MTSKVHQKHNGHMAAKKKACSVCGEQEMTFNEFSESAAPFLNAEDWCSDCCKKNEMAERLRPYLQRTIDDLLNEEEPFDAANNIRERIQAQELEGWPDESGFGLTLHQRAFLHVFDLKLMIPMSGLDGHLGDLGKDYLMLLSALKIAGFTEAFSLLNFSEAGPDAVEDEVDKAIDWEKLIDFVRENSEMFFPVFSAQD